ncbi:hypothetical protein B296_00056883 [Ensete ventricosum]|uniref:Retrotransposon gag domain-containing protein n=1 Tax=Ensete ventricosum TaxID=4639 RepID=A0A426WXR5_ENSVE|nr:hypothetical protein B296_00056883 [Ensete ventricosum]
MSQERPLGNSGAEHRPEPNHSQPTKEVTAAAPTLNHFWRMMTDPGFPSPAFNPAPFVVTTKAFLGLTSQVQALVSMVQTIVPYLSQLIHSANSPIGSPDDVPANGVACDSPFTPEIQGKPLLANFRLPTFEPYDGSGDPIKHIATFYPQMALYDTSDALMCRAFSTTLRGPTRTWTETVEVLLVTNRATARNATRDATTGASIHGRRDVGGRQAGRDEAPWAPNPMKLHSERCDKRMYYRFHREHDHDTKECRDLQYQIEDLIRRGQ